MKMTSLNCSASCRHFSVNSSRFTRFGSCEEQMCLKITRAEDKPRRNRFNEHSLLLISMVLVELSTKLRRDYMREPCDNRFCSLLLFKVREINRFLEICHRDPRKILRGPRNSILDPQASNLDSFKDRGLSFESRLSTYICTVL